MLKRVPVVVAFAATLLLAGSAAATSRERDAGASARAYAIRIVSSAGGGGTKELAAPADEVQFGGAFAYPADSSILTSPSNSASVSADSGSVATATASADVTSISLFAGEITASAVAARATSTASLAGAKGTTAGSAVSGLVALGQPVASGSSAQLADWGTLTTLEQSSSPMPGAAPGYHVFVTALHVHLTADHGGLPAGSDILVGYAESTAQASKAAPVPTAPGKTTTVAKPLATPPPEPKPTPGLPNAYRPPPSVHPTIGPTGYVFPVYGPSSYIDTFGGLRPDVSGGWHHGDDIFAPLGAPLLAVADGIVFSVGWNEVGGNRLWLRDRAGNEYYYAHLSAFSPLARNGAQVQAGDVVGFVGNSGDAQGTPYHLHFEVHPASLLYLGYDGAIDPSSYLDGWKRLQDVRFDAASGWAPAAGTSVNAPQPGAILLQASDISSASGLEPSSLARAVLPIKTEGEGGLLAAVTPSQGTVRSTPASTGAAARP